MCTITIDATGYIAHLKFETGDLGVMYSGYTIGDWIEIPSGK